MRRGRKFPHGCPTGSAVATGAGNLPAKYVIHAVGPVHAGGDHNEAELLAGAYRTSLALAAELGCESIALPALSTGAYRYPLPEVARIAWPPPSITWKCTTCHGPVRFVLFSGEARANFEIALRELQSKCKSRLKSLNAPVRRERPPSLPAPRRRPPGRCRLGEPAMPASPTAGVGKSAFRCQARKSLPSTSPSPLTSPLANVAPVARPKLAVSAARSTSSVFASPLKSAGFPDAIDRSAEGTRYRDSPLASSPMAEGEQGFPCS